MHVVQRFAGGKSAGLPRHVDAEEIETKVREEVNELSNKGLNVSLQVISVAFVRGGGVRHRDALSGV